MSSAPVGGAEFCKSKEKRRPSWNLPSDSQDHTRTSSNVPIEKVLVLRDFTFESQDFILALVDSKNFAEPKSDLFRRDSVDFLKFSKNCGASRQITILRKAV